MSLDFFEIFAHDRPSPLVGRLWTWSLGLAGNAEIVHQPPNVAFMISDAELILEVLFREWKCPRGRIVPSLFQWLI